MGVETSVDIFQFTDYQQLARDIIDSYHHPWDQISELVSNAFSSIFLARKEKKGGPWKIEITLNQQSKYLEVVDIGIGIPKDLVPQILAPAKRGEPFREPFLPSEKGLGLSFVLLSSDRFEIESCYNGKTSAAEYVGAYNWVNSVPEIRRPLLKWIKPTIRPGKENYTRIRVSGRNVNFDFSPEELVYTLRTKTAIGNIKALFDESIVGGFEVRMIHIDKNGKKTDTEVEPTYLFPSDYWKRSISLGNFKDEAARGMKKHYTDYALTIKKDEGGGKCYCAMYATPEVYDDLAEQMGLSPRKWGKRGEVIGEGYIQPAIWVSSKGVSHGVTIGTPKTGSAGMWAGVYLVINNDDLIYDAGKKSFKENEALKWVKRKVKEIFATSIEPYFPSFARRPTGRIPAVALDDQIACIDKTRKLPDLGVPDLPFQKEPDNESSTIALFHELVSRGYLKGYHTLAVFSTDEIYDALINYVPPAEIGKQAFRIYRAALKKRKGVPIIAEFKHELSSLIRDIEHEKKFSSPLLNLIICWYVNKKKISGAGWKLEKTPDGEALFHGAQYRLYPHEVPWAGVEVLVLEDFTDDIRKHKFKK